MKKKSLAILLTLSLTASLCGCGKGKKDSTEDTGLTEIETTEGVSEEEQGYVRPEQNTEVESVISTNLAEISKNNKENYQMNMNERCDYTYEFGYGFQLPTACYIIESGQVYETGDIDVTWQHLYTDEWLSIETISNVSESDILNQVNEKNKEYEVATEWEDYTCIENTFKHKSFYINKETNLTLDVFVHTRLDGRVGIISCMFITSDEWEIMLHSMHELSEQSEKKWGNYQTNSQQTTEVSQDNTENGLQTESQDSANTETESENIESNSEDTSESEDTDEE